MTIFGQGSEAPVSWFIATLVDICQASMQSMLNTVYWWIDKLIHRWSDNQVQYTHFHQLFFWFFVYVNHNVASFFVMFEIPYLALTWDWVYLNCRMFNQKENKFILKSRSHCFRSHSSCICRSLHGASLRWQGDFAAMKSHYIIYLSRGEEFGHRAETGSPVASRCCRISRQMGSAAIRSGNLSVIR